MSSRESLQSNQLNKRRLNQVYVDLVTWLHALLDLLPGFVRNALLRRILKRVGRHVYFDHKVFIKFPRLVEIGDRVSINRGVEFYSDFIDKHRIVIGSDVHIAPNVKFHAAGHDLENLVRHVGADIVVGDGVWIGASSLILPGVTIGANSIVGAGSVVTSDVPPGKIAAGVPARVIRDVPAVNGDTRQAREG